MHWKHKIIKVPIFHNRCECKYINMSDVFDTLVNFDNLLLFSFDSIFVF